MKIKSILCGLVCLCLLSGCSGKQTTSEVSSYDSEYVSSYEDTSSVTLDTTSVPDTSSTSTEVVSSGITSSEVISSIAESKTSNKTSSKVSSKAPNKTESKVSSHTSSKVSSTQSTQKPNEDKNKKYQAEIEAENERYQQKAETITRDFNRWIKDNNDLIQSYKNQGYIYSGDWNQYEYDVSTLESEINKVQNKIRIYSMDTSGRYKRELEKAQSELKELESQLSNIRIGWNLACEIRGLEGDNDGLKEQKQMELEKAREEHEENIKKIKEKYGM